MYILQNDLSEYLQLYYMLSNYYNLACHIDSKNNNENINVFTMHNKAVMHVMYQVASENRNISTIYHD